MKTSVFLIGLLVLSSLAVSVVAQVPLTAQQPAPQLLTSHQPAPQLLTSHQPAPQQPAPQQPKPEPHHETHKKEAREQVIAEALKSTNERLNKIKEKLEKCIKDGKNCKVLEKLRHKFEEIKRAVAQKRKEVELMIDAAQARGTVKYYKLKIKEAKSAPKKDKALIKQYKHDLRSALRDHERIRIKEERALAKKIKKEQRRMKREHKRVVKCEHHPEKLGCKKLLEKYGAQKAKTLELKNKRHHIELKISTSRQNHVKAFEKVKSIQAKKAIILNRYNIKIEHIEKKIQRLQEKLTVLSRHRTTDSDVKKYKRTQRRLKYWQNRLEALKKEEHHAITLKSSGPGCCFSCEETIHHILNDIHVNLVFHTSTGKTIIKTIHVEKETDAKPPRYQIVHRFRDVVKSHRKYVPHVEMREEEVTGTRQVMKAHKTKKLRTWTTTEKVRRKHDFLKDHTEKRLHHWTTSETVKVPHKVLKNHQVKVLKKWFTWETRKVPHVVNPTIKTHKVKKTFTRTKKVPKTKHRKVTKQVPYEDKVWVTKKVLVIKERKFRNQALEYIKKPDGTGAYEWVDKGYETKKVPTWVENKVLETVKKVKTETVDEPYQVMEDEPESYTVEVEEPIGNQHPRTEMRDEKVKVWHEKWVTENHTKEEVELRDQVVKKHHQELRDHTVKRLHHEWRDEVVQKHHQKLEDHIEYKPETETFKTKVKRAHHTHKWIEEKQTHREHYTERVPVADEEDAKL